MISLGSHDFLIMRRKRIGNLKLLENSINDHTPFRHQITYRSEKCAQEEDLRLKISKLIFLSFKCCFKIKLIELVKGQLISKGLFGVIVWTKKPTNFFKGFLPYLASKFVDKMQFVNSQHLVADFLRINCMITTLLKLPLLVLILHNKIELIEKLA